MTETKSCQNCKKNFVIEPEDFVFYEKMKVPPPTFCPPCRLARRLAWRNESTFYKRPCNAPGHTEDVISTFSPDKPFIIYDQKYWWSDAWEKGPVSFDYDFSSPFFAQFRELLEKTPFPNLSTDYATMVNSEYTNKAGDMRNCYLVVDSDSIENSAYGSGWMSAKECFDCDNIRHTELCYGSFDLEKCYRTIGSVGCKDCTDLLFSKNCSGCSNCFGCSNLRNKKYCFFNEQLDKGAYEERVRALALDTYEGYKAAQTSAEAEWLRSPEKFFHGVHNTDVTGDYIYHCKNVKEGYLVTDAEDSKFVSLIHDKPTKDCYDYTDYGGNVQNIYECLGVGLGGYNIKLSHVIFGEVRDVEYSHFCTRSSNLFGCTGIMDRQYCILNKQYSKEEYFALREKIIQQMNDMPYVDAAGRVYKYGEFFPQEIAPFCYNETVAQEFFPLTEQAAKVKKITWKNEDARGHAATLKSSEIPHKISEVSDDILKQTIGCEHESCNHKCTKAFRIIPRELSFYRQLGLPLPRLCPNCRHYGRLKHRNPINLWHRQCMKEGCDNEFETSYAPDRPEIIYCESCYNKEVA